LLPAAVTSITLDVRKICIVLVQFLFTAGNVTGLVVMLEKIVSF